MNVLQAIEIMIREKGFDGLCNLDNDNCGCLADDLAPCGSMSEYCVLGYKGREAYCSNGTWAIYETKEAAEESRKGGQNDGESDR